MTVRFPSPVAESTPQRQPSCPPAATLCVAVLVSILCVVRAGVGTGLTVAKRIVERHNGRIWLDSQPGQGTCFYVLLPCEEQQIPAMFV